MLGYGLGNIPLTRWSVKMPDEPTVCGVDLWPEGEQRRRAWIAEILCNSTLAIDEPADILTVADMMFRWVNTGSIVGELAPKANVHPLRPA